MLIQIENVGTASQSSNVTPDQPGANEGVNLGAHLHVCARVI